ncbi:MAG: glycosyltransferase, partial [Candidatus Curtissbacteria bacterium]
SGIIKFIKKEKIHYNLLHSNYWFSGLVSVGISQRLNIPQVHIFHSTGKIRLKILKELGRADIDPVIEKRIQTEEILANQINNFIASSPIEKHLLNKTFSIPTEKIEFIPIGVDTKLFRPIEEQEAKKILKIKNSAKVIISVSRIEENKGIETLIRAFQKIESIWPEALLYIVGGEKNQLKRGNEIYQLKKLAKQLGLARKVKFAGQVDQKKLYLYYSAASVCAVPSYYETFGIVPLEAMACGIPVVASNTGGLKFTVRNGKTGFLAKPKDANDLFEKINSALYLDKSYFSKQCLLRVDHYFRWNQIAMRYIDYYTEAIKLFTDKKHFIGSISSAEINTLN